MLENKMFTLEELKEAFLNGYRSGSANGYSYTPYEIWNEYIKDLEQEEKDLQKYIKR